MEQVLFTAITPNVSAPAALLAHSTWNVRGLVPSVVLSVCFMIGVPGNIAVLASKPNFGNLSGVSQSLMLNLAVFDLLCLLTLPLWIYSLIFDWIFTLAACKLLSWLVYGSVYGSQLTVTALSIQRYAVVVSQHRGHLMHKRRLLVLLWVFAFACSCPDWVIRRLERDHLWTHCTRQFSSKSQQIAVLLTETLIGTVSFILVTISYIGIKKKVSGTVFFNNPQTTRLVTSIIMSNFILWTPFHITNLLGVVALSLENQDLLRYCTTAWYISKALIFVNCCLNPVLYAFTSRKLCVFCPKKDLPAPESQTFS